MKFLSTSLFGLTSILLLVYCYPAAFAFVFNNASAMLHSQSKNTIGLRIYLIYDVDEKSSDQDKLDKKVFP
jgi:hypothetical protein